MKKYLELSDGERRCAIVHFEDKTQQTFTYGLLERTFERINPDVSPTRDYMFEVKGPKKNIFKEIEKTKQIYANIRKSI